MSLFSKAKHRAKEPSGRPKEADRVKTDGVETDGKHRVEDMTEEPGGTVTENVQDAKERTQHDIQREG